MLLGNFSKRNSKRISEYEREFVQLSKYARECIPTEVAMCKRFEEGLNEDVKLLVEIVELKEFVVLVDRAHKAEELNKEKRQAKIFIGETQSSASKKSKKYLDHSVSSVGYFGNDRGYQRSNPRSPTPSVASARSVGNPKPRCKHCNKFHFGEYHMRSGVCYRCDFFNHYLKVCQERIEKDIVRTLKPSNPTSRGRPPCNPSNICDSQGARKDSTANLKHELQPEHMLYVHVRMLLHLISTHSYICTNLVFVKNLPVEFTEFVVKVSNPFSQYVMVDTICKNCPLMVRGYCFLSNLMLFPFDEFDVILGIDWLTQHDAVVICKHKYIVLKF
ncbi:Gag-Pol polyprotein [Gossypium australe]|uniref:Gag-Pol polyprotein n=1 Tax=Gossypium australe TaxID=47621 RepID=A0A5B6VAW2_9ROSI|nr:Gag-Pol polyprotein [Gossypium australe]